MKQYFKKHNKKKNFKNRSAYIPGNFVKILKGDILPKEAADCGMIRESHKKSGNLTIVLPSRLNKTTVFCVNIRNVMTVVKISETEYRKDTCLSKISA